MNQKRICQNSRQLRLLRHLSFVVKRFPYMASKFDHLEFPMFRMYFSNILENHLDTQQAKIQFIVSWAREYQPLIIHMVFLHGDGPKTYFGSIRKGFAVKPCGTIALKHNLIVRCWKTFQIEALSVCFPEFSSPWAPARPPTHPHLLGRSIARISDPGRLLRRPQGPDRRPRAPMRTHQGSDKRPRAPTKTTPCSDK